MPNQHVNKVVQRNGNTLIDISDTTAIASDVASGKYFYLATGAKVAGTKTEKELDTKTITLNGTYAASSDNVDGYSEVTVNVQNGATMTEVANTYGTGVVITSAQGAAPSATRHTLYFEYEDTTTETVYAYYDDALIGQAITATTPTTHNNKTVTLAQLDGTTWYSYTPTPTPSGDWQTVYESADEQVIEDDGKGLFWIGDLGSETLTVGDVWRITIDGTPYVASVTSVNNEATLGNPIFGGGTDDGSGVPFAFVNRWSAWIGATDLAVIPVGEYTFKAEKQVST